MNKLQALLARVQDRAASPRSVDTVSTEQSLGPGLELDEPGESVIPPASPELRPLSSVPKVSSPPASIQELDMDDFEEVSEKAPESGENLLDLQNAPATPEPPMTPPPESGEAISSTRVPPLEGPTPEQLGATISLEEGPSKDFELDAPIVEEPAMVEPVAATGSGADTGSAAASLAADSRPADSIAADSGPMEAQLAPGLRDDQLRSPDSAREDLARVRLGEVTPIEARVVSRPVISTNVVDFVEASKNFEPKSFLELLDATLSLK
jgi:hypothetical protein